MTSGSVIRQDDSDGYSNSSIVIDMNSTNSCSDFPAYPSIEARGAAGAVLDGSPLICGGIGPDFTKCYIHNKTSYNWEFLVDMGKNRYDHTMAMYNGAMWVVSSGTYVQTTQYIYPNGSIFNGPEFEAYWADHGTSHNIAYGQCMVTLPNGEAMFIGGDGNFLVTLVLSILGLLAVLKKSKKAFETFIILS